MQISPLKILRNTNWRMVLAGVCAVGMLHIIAVFTEPRLAQSNAYARLAPNLPLNKMVVMPPITSDNQPLPFLSPDARYAVCRFITAYGPVAFNAVLLGPGWLATVYSEDGASLNTTVAVPERNQTIVALRLVPSDDRFMGLTPQAAGRSAKSTTALPVGAKSGIIVVRAPNRGPAFADLHEAALLQASCRQLKSK
ncbi:MAG: hypothetical protein K0U34_07875 [Alphaproteobacteria bacterium]|nr:hypothetical protein [Alphaproteobacteria bacterium]